MIGIASSILLSCLSVAQPVETQDTLHIHWSESGVQVESPKTDGVTCETDSMYVSLAMMADAKPVVISLSGRTTDGGISINSPHLVKLYMNGVSITSHRGPALVTTSSTIMLAKQTQNALCDAYHKRTTDHNLKACVEVDGNLALTGTGALQVTGAMRNGIVCSGDVSMSDGKLDVCVSRDASKGLDCKSLSLSGGDLNVKGCGNAVYKDSTVVFSSLVKAHGSVNVSGGELHLEHSGKGGRCLSCGDSLRITGGKLTARQTGNGGWFGEKQRGRHYWDTRDYRTYYSPHCLSAQKAIIIERGDVSCFSSGNGGKGLSSNGYLQIGRRTDKKAEQGPAVKVETTGDCIYNDSLLDKREGCPKAIRAKNTVVYSGNIIAQTTRMGGEGIEADSLTIYNPNIICNTFDDGLNIKRALTINGGSIYCCSKDNDGIDSNGSITINGGTIASISQHHSNESLDAAQSQIVINGGTVFGVGSSTVKMQSTKCAIYNSPSVPVGDGRAIRPTLDLKAGQYLCLMDGQKLLMTLLNKTTNSHSSILAVWPKFITNKHYDIVVSDVAPTNCTSILFDGQFMLGGNLDILQTKPLEGFNATPWVNKDKENKNIHNLK